MTTNSEYSIITNNLTIGYSQKNIKNELLSNLNLNAKPGSLIALIGENGSGKSTLLKTILRLHNPISGKISLFDKSLNSYSLNSLAKIISYVSTEIISVQNLTVFNLVALGRFPYTNWLGKLNKEDKAIVNNSLEQVGMIKHINKNVNEISDGERQRVLIARTLAQNTPITILDEPTSFLDMPNKFEIIHLLNQLAKEKSKTIIFSTHDLNIAIQEADILWLINEKKIIKGTSEDLILNGEFSKIFEKSKLDFNIETGEFGITRNLTKSITLKGKGASYLWTYKALKRFGIKINPNKKNGISVIIREKNSKTYWELQGTGETKIVNSIQKLIEALNLITYFD